MAAILSWGDELISHQWSSLIELTTMSHDGIDKQ